ncbi:MAG: 2-isopropylmalate synthase [Clostridia bacterium]
MKRIKFFDTTLRDGEQSPGCSMNLHEKLEVAAQLVKLNVDVIEAGFAIASAGDLESIQAIAKAVKGRSVASLSRALEKDIDAAWNAVKGAEAPRIHTFLATSPIHMEYKLRMTPEQVIERTANMVAYAKKFCSDIQFSAEDASRSDWGFLVKVFDAAIKSGATVLNVPDTVGYTTPEEMYNLIFFLKNNVPNIDTVDIAVHCHNDLGLAVANSLAAVRAGATQVECTINGIGERAGNAAIEEIVMGMTTRKDYYDVSYQLDTTQLYRSSRLIQSITGVPVAPSKSIVGANAFAHESGIHQHGVMAEKTTYEIMTPESVGIPKNSMVLGKHSGRHAFDDRLSELGYNLDKAEIEAAFARFKTLADKKKIISDFDLEAIVSDEVHSSEDEIKLDSFVINSGNNISSTAIIKLSIKGEIIEKVAIGDGPINAAFTAINKAIGIDVELDDFSLHSVTEGEDALGEAVVKLKKDNATATGRGLSNDIVEASIKAYLNGLNKLL